MTTHKEIKFGKVNGKNAAVVRCVMSNGAEGPWFRIAISEAKRQLKAGADINGNKVVEA